MKLPSTIWNCANFRGEPCQPSITTCWQWKSWPCCSSLTATCPVPWKPFKGVNGSGPLFGPCPLTLGEFIDPTRKPKKPITFCWDSVSILQGLKEHSGLYVHHIASSSNEHRLGANEALRQFICLLGWTIEWSFEFHWRGSSHVSKSQQTYQANNLGGKNRFESIHYLNCSHSTDRNRNIPDGFYHHWENKFEFRAVGSSQSLPSYCHVEFMLLLVLKKLHLPWLPGREV